MRLRVVTVDFVTPVSPQMIWGDKTWMELCPDETQNT